MKPTETEMRTTLRVVIALILVLSTLTAHSAFATQHTETKSNDTATTRPANWGQPIALHGAPNLNKLSDSLYRGAQPTSDGFKELQKLGIKTVINLRSFNSDRSELKGTEMK